MSGRTLLEILDAARDGDMPTREECHEAMLALDALLSFESRDISKLVQRLPRAAVERIYAEESFRRRKLAFAKPPREWLGEHNMPGHSEQVRMRRVAKWLLARMEARDD